MYISEAGADSFNINSNAENETQQAQATEIILNAIIAKSDLCIGVTLFEFCDEWWKAGNPNQQDPGGFSNAIPEIQLTVPSGTRKRPSLSFTVSLSLPLSGLSSGSGVGPNASP